MSSQTDRESKRPSLRWLRWVGVGFFALSVVFVILAFLPEHRSFEPDWLARIPPALSSLEVRENMVYPPSSGKLSDVQTTELTRFVEMPFDEFLVKLNKDLRPEDGWHFSHPYDTFSASWNKSDKAGSSTIWIIQEGAKIRVTSLDAHTLNWFDKLKRSVARLLGR